MRLLRIGLRSFRNLADADIELPPEGLALVGENAQGKSNFLEAIYYLEAFRSFRGSRDEQLIRFDQEFFRVVGDVGSEAESSSLEVAVAFQRSPRVKKVSVDGQEVPRLSDGVGRVGVVVMTPDDLRLVTDGPHERRHFLNVLLSLNDPTYLAALQRFRQILVQRNAALRDGAPAPTVSAWDEGLVRWGSVVIGGRARWIQESVKPFREYYRGISEAESARLEYDPGTQGLEQAMDEGAIREAYHRVLVGARERELRQGTTVVGPHRDEFRIHVEAQGREQDLRSYGSGGQRRTAALALRLLEADAVRVRRGWEPLLLLDDVFAELDEGRSVRVLELLDRTAVGQVILTAPKEGDVRFRKDRLAHWAIRDGEILH